MSDKYQLTVNERQLGIIQRALETHARLGLGQVWAIEDSLPNRSPEKPDGFYMSFEAIKELSSVLLTRILRDLEEAHKNGAEKAPFYFAQRDTLDLAQMLLTGISPGASYGVGSKFANKDADPAFDIRDVIRHFTSWERHPKGGFGVCFNEPFGWGNEPLPVIKKVEE